MRDSLPSTQMVDVGELSLPGQSARCPSGQDLRRSITASSPTCGTPCDVSVFRIASSRTSRKMSSSSSTAASSSTIRAAHFGRGSSVSRSESLPITCGLLVTRARRCVRTSKLPMAVPRPTISWRSAKTKRCCARHSLRSISIAARFSWPTTSMGPQARRSSMRSASR